MVIAAGIEVGSELDYDEGPAQYHHQLDRRAGKSYLRVGDRHLHLCRHRHAAVFQGLHY